MALGIHALDIADVIASLTDGSRGPGRVRSRQPTRQHPGACADRGAASASKSRACGCSKSRADSRASYSAHGRRTAGCAAGPFVSELPADIIIVTKLVKTSAIARQGHHAGARRHAYTPG